MSETTPNSGECRCTSGPTDPPCPLGEQHVCAAVHRTRREQHSCRCGAQWAEKHRPTKASPIPRLPTPWRVDRDVDNNVIVVAADGAKVAGDVAEDVAALIVRLVNVDPDQSAEAAPTLDLVE